MGYRADEVIGKSNSIFFTDPKEADRIMEQVQKEGEITKELVLEKRIMEELDNLNLIFESMVDAVYIVSKDYENIKTNDI